MAIADAIADLQDVVDLAKTLQANWDSTYSSILSSQLGAPTEDDYGRLERLAKDVVDGWRPNFAEMMESIRTLADEVLADLAREMDRNDAKPSDPPVTILRALRLWMLDNTVVFESRGVTHNAVSSLTSPLTSGADGALLMESQDDQSTADDLEAVTADTLRFECIADQGTPGGASGRELFKVYASVGVPRRDILENGSIDEPTNISVVSAATASGIKNGTFEAAFSGTGTDKISSWTFSSGQANVAAEATTVYRGSQALSVTGTFLMKQAYAGLPADTPVLLSLMHRAAATNTGVLKIRIGGVSTSVDLSDVDDDTWRRLHVITWPKLFSGSGFDVEIEVDESGLSPDDSYSGTLLLDECVVHPLTRIGGRFFILVAGATDYAIGDYYTQATSIAGTGLNKEWLHRWYGRGFELPNDGTPTAGWEDPT